VWYCITQDKTTGEPVLGEPALEVHVYNYKDKTELSQESSDEQEVDPIDNKTRRSPVMISPTRAAAPMMFTIMTTPVITITAGHSVSHSQEV
jgi:hypothetical protein